MVRLVPRWRRGGAELAPRWRRDVLWLHMYVECERGAVCHYTWSCAAWRTGVCRRSGCAKRRVRVCSRRCEALRRAPMHASTPVRGRRDADCIRVAGGDGRSRCLARHRISRQSFRADREAGHVAERCFVCARVIMGACVLYACGVYSCRSCLRVDCVSVVLRSDGPLQSYDAL